jgi:hypothetical protein
MDGEEVGAALMCDVNPGCWAERVELMPVWLENTKFIILVCVFIINEVCIGMYTSTCPQIIDFKINLKILL